MTERGLKNKRFLFNVYKRFLFLSRFFKRFLTFFYFFLERFFTSMPNHALTYTQGPVAADSDKKWELKLALKMGAGR